MTSENDGPFAIQDPKQIRTCRRIEPPRWKLEAEPLRCLCPTPGKAYEHFFIVATPSNRAAT